MTLLKKSQLSAKQERAIDRLFEHDTTILIAPTGAGKTVITLTAIGELIQSNDLRRVVVACPAKVVRGFSNEHTKWDHLAHLNVVALEGSVAERTENLKRGADIFVVSLNSFEWFCQQDHGCDGVIIDELSKACGKQTASLKTKSRGDVFTWRVGMTATPVSENFQKLHKMVRIIDKGKALGTNFQKYLSQYFSSDYMGFNWTLLPGFDKVILDKVKHLIYMVKDEKETELPPITFETIEFDMPSETLDVYKQMKKEMVVGDVEAVNAAVKSGKLRQIGSGFLYDEDGLPEWFDDARMTALGRVWLRGLKGAKGVIYYEYTAQLDQILECLTYFGHTSSIIAGGMSGKRVEAEMVKFEDPKGSQFLVAQINALSHGVDRLQFVCHKALFIHPMWSRDAFEQAYGRLWRTGQEHPVSVSTLACRQSLDPLVLLRGESKSEFMKLFKLHLKEQ